MAQLSAREIAQYQSEGWVIPQFRLPEARVATMREALDELIRDNPGVRPEKLVSAHVEGDNGEGVRGSRALPRTGDGPGDRRAGVGRDRRRRDPVGLPRVLQAGRPTATRRPGTRTATTGRSGRWPTARSGWRWRSRRSRTAACASSRARTSASALHEHLHEDRTDLTLNQRMAAGSFDEASAVDLELAAGPDVAARRLHDPRRPGQHARPSAAPASRCATCPRPRCSSATCGRSMARAAWRSTSRSGRCGCCAAWTAAAATISRSGIDVGDRFGSATVRA